MFNSSQVGPLCPLGKVAFNWNYKLSLGVPGASSLAFLQLYTSASFLIGYNLPQGWGTCSSGEWSPNSVGRFDYQWEQGGGRWWQGQGGMGSQYTRYAPVYKCMHFINQCSGCVCKHCGDRTSFKTQIPCNSESVCSFATHMILHISWNRPFFHH